MQEKNQELFFNLLSPSRGFSRSSTRRWMMGLAVLALPFMVNAPVHAERWGEVGPKRPQETHVLRRVKGVAGLVIMTAEKRVGT